SVGGGHRPECSKPMPQLLVAYALAPVSLARWTPIFTVHVVCLSSRRLPLRGNFLPSLSPATSDCSCEGFPTTAPRPTPLSPLAVVRNPSHFRTSTSTIISG